MQPTAQPTAQPTVVLDATPLDTGHRTRGIGRYVQGLIEGFEALKASNTLSVGLKLLRTPSAAPHPDFATVPYPRRMFGGATAMFLENQLRLDRYLPPDTALYHATSMDGVSKRYPWVATCHDLIPLLLRGPYLKPWNLSARWFWPTYASLLKDGPRQIVATSHHVKGTLSERFGIDPARINVIHHGLSPFWFEPATAQGVNDRIKATAEQKDFILFVGGFDPRKNLPTLLRALSIMPPSLRPRLLLAGVCGQSIRDKELNPLIRRWKLDVVYLDFVNDIDLRWLYAQARCLAFPSIEEGWGFPIVEAMAVGTPVVCADWGSMVEAAGGAAVTTDVKRFEDLSHSVRVLLESDSTRAERIEAGRQRARSLTWGAYAERLQAVYQAALSDR